MFDTQNHATAPLIWEVGALCRAVADSLQARFNPVAVRGELAGFSRAASGHCYFTLKDAQGQLRCAMFRRAASQLTFNPRDGDQVELRASLGLYETRGDLQLIVEDMRQAGQGQLFEQFLRLKAQLEAEGLFDAGRKRPLPVMPRCTTWRPRWRGAYRIFRWCWHPRRCRARQHRRCCARRYHSCICWRPLSKRCKPKSL